MSAAFLVASILAIGWNLVIAALVVFTDTHSYGKNTDAGRAMHRCLRPIRAEIGTLELNAQPGRSGRRDDSAIATNQVRSDVGKTSLEVEVDVPYASASVSVTADEKQEPRRCSVCLN